MTLLLWIILIIVLGLGARLLYAYYRRIYFYSKFEEEYLSFLSILVSELRCGLGLLEAINFSREYLPPHGELSNQLKNLLARVSNGENLPHVIQDFARNSYPDLQLFRSTILLALEQGASLVPCLIRLRKFTNERQVVRRRLQSAVAAQKISAIGIVFALLSIVGFQVLSDPSVWELLSRSFMGQMVLLLSSGLVGVGILGLFLICRVKF
jgi:Flp pilus assembly protein TadB